MPTRLIVSLFALAGIAFVSLSGCDKVLEIIVPQSDRQSESNDSSGSLSPDEGKNAQGSRVGEVPEPVNVAEPPKLENTAVGVQGEVVEENSLLAGIPPLDVTIGPNLSDLERDESQELSKKAVALYRKNDFKGAIQYFIKALEKNPSNLQFRYNLSACYALGGEPEKALALLEQMKDSPDCTRCFISLSEAVGDDDFSSIKQNSRFIAATSGAPERLKAELKAANWLRFDTSSRFLPIVTNGLPAISDDGKRIAVTAETNSGYRLQLILVSSGKVTNNVALLTPKELDAYRQDELRPSALKGVVKKRIDEAHQLLFGRNWLPFGVKAANISPTWLRGETRQQFILGNSSVRYSYPNLLLTNSKGRIIYQGKIGEFPSDDCTQIVAINEAYVNGDLHTMLFKLGNSSSRRDCQPTAGKFYVVQLTE